VLVEINCETDFVAKDANFSGSPTTVARTGAGAAPRPMWTPCWR
jgi:translation elongation factor EF-Ts